MTISKFLTLISILSAVTVSGCTDSAQSNGGDTQTNKSTTKTNPASSKTDVNLGAFYDDNDSGCQVFISVPNSVANSENDARVESWKTLKSENFDVCDVSEPSVIGIVTVGGLDDYNQPDWSNTVEHFKFALSDWPAFKTACETTENANQCGQALSALLIIDK